MFKVAYVWEFPVRLTHWVNVLCIILLSATGFYIGHPYLRYTISNPYIMGWMRLLHFVLAYVFTLSVLLRIYWALVGNKYAGWREFVPLSVKRWQEIFNCVKFYTFFSKVPPFFVGHSALAAVSYLGLFGLFIVEIVTGFALYSQSHVGLFWKLAGGWLLPLVPLQLLRYVHHLIMWLIGVFFIVHMYIAWLIDLTEKSSVISSIFNGYKTVHEE